MDCSQPGSSAHGILQARILEWAGDLPDPEIEPRSPALQADSLPSESPGKPHMYTDCMWMYIEWLPCFYFFKDSVYVCGVGDGGATINPSGQSWWGSSQTDTMSFWIGRWGTFNFQSVCFSSSGIFHSKHVSFLKLLIKTTPPCLELLSLPFSLPIQGTGNTHK